MPDQPPSSPPLPDPPPLEPPPLPPKQASLSEYQVVADKVGFVPNLRKKDNLYQLLVAVACAVGGAIWAPHFAAKYLADTPMTQSPAAYVIGGLAGFVIGGVVAGVVLAVVGLVRKS